MLSEIFGHWNRLIYGQAHGPLPSITHVLWRREQIMAKDRHRYLWIPGYTARKGLHNCHSNRFSSNKFRGVP